MLLTENGEELPRTEILSAGDTLELAQTGLAAYGDAVSIDENGTVTPVKAGTAEIILSDTGELVCLVIVNMVEQNGLFGDVNGDGEVDILDVIMLNKFLPGAAILDDAARQRADVDVNKEIDSTDSLIILKKVISLIDTLPVV